MKKHGVLLALLALVAVGASGVLPRSREMEELKLVTALAFDGTKVTALTGVRVTEEEEAQALTGEGESLAAACNELRTAASRRAYLGQTRQILLGEGQDTAQALDFVLLDRELRLDTLLYIVKGNAGEALAAAVEQTAEETGGEDPRGRTVGETLPRLTQGYYAAVPALQASEEGGLAPAGWAVLGPDGVAGYLEEEGAWGADLLLGIGTGKVAVLPGGSVELTGIRVGSRKEAVTCTLTGRTVEGHPTQEELEVWGKERLRAALVPGWDCWGLEQAQALWGNQNPEVSTLEVQVTGRLVSGSEGRT
ncbi:MAG: hypothetical protein K2F83_01435 [Oscillospiraceae bacterium]|nr:hypothetical protein [Oscillospiraceae bacterium]